MLNVHVCSIEVISWQKNDGLLCYTSLPTRI